MKASIRSVLAVCTGNICRSPMAEWLLRDRLEGAEVASAGIGAVVGHPAEPDAVAVMDEIGFDLSPHRARQFDLAVASGFELILVMETGQKRWIEAGFPVLRGRVRLLGEWLGEEIPDPLGHDLGFFRQVRDLTVRSVDAWMGRL